MKPAPFAVDEDEVAETVIRGLERDAELVCAPQQPGPIFEVLGHPPRRLWRHLPK